MQQSEQRAVNLRTLVHAGVIVLLALNLIVVLGSILLLYQARAYLVGHTRAQKVQLELIELENDLLRAESGQRGYTYTGRDEFLIDFDRVNQFPERITRIQEQVVDNQAQLDRASALHRTIGEKVAFMRRTVALRRSNAESELRNVVASGEALRLGTEIHTLMTEMIRSESGSAQKRREQLYHGLSVLHWTLLGGLAMSMGTGVWVLSFLSRRLAPLLASGLLAERIGRGDLTSSPLPVLVYDEIGQVTASLNHMLANLRKLTRNNLKNADQLNGSAAKIASATREQAVALQEQSTAMQETSVTIEELSQSARQIAERAREVASRAELTSKAASAGLEAVQKTVHSTQSIVDQVAVVAEKIMSLSEKTQAIRDIVLSVNDIAERSNVLALNASILAAAAGPEGKAFTVVANEMKSLADQSKEATVNVRSLLGDVEKGIQASVFLIEEAAKRGAAGSVYTDEADQTIRQLAAQITDGVHAFQQIVAATNQQQLAFEQVTEALLSIRQATQQSAASTQQLEQAAQELYRLSGNLVGSLDAYKIEGQAEAEE